MKLTPKTVYIPITEHNTNTASNVAAQFMGIGNVFLEKCEGYFLTKEELTELLGKTWDAGFGRGYSRIMKDIIPEQDQPLSQEQYINELLSQIKPKP